ncbi:hypothetical protein [Pontibacter oryzae]|uniref:T9SS C-terminal target domain-containing protein n=1 Tax=Pontibacter oryzae TaxID=2304593 RepID=A0A399SIL2_9BACT|nr:hypothetical protein [Pontibacter oryzae]RIJ41565.1 hypothetical protein D1627_05895 [Pontibacter oryzae]
MKKSFFTLAVSLFTVYSLAAQSLISEFNWDDRNQPATAAKYGKSAKALGAHAGIVSGGVAASNGLGIAQDHNAAPAPAPVSFVMDGSDFNVDGLEVSFEFNAHNTNGNGSLFARLHQDATQPPVFSLFIQDYKLQLRYTLANGEVVMLKDIATVPTTDELSFYSFRYLPITGEMEVYMGTELVAYRESKSIPLSWANAGDAVLGHNLYVAPNDVHDTCEAKPSTAVFDNFTATSITENQVLLPAVHFLKLTAVADKGQINLSWTTEAEAQKLAFSVERSQDGTLYEALSATQLNTSLEDNKLVYMYTDKTAKVGKVYYRITQFNKDGSKLISNVAEIPASSNIATSGAKMSVYPTLVQNQEVKFELKGVANNGQANITIMSFGGSIVRNKSVELSQATPGTQILAAGELQEGVYIVLLTHNNITYREKLVVR